MAKRLSDYIPDLWLQISSASGENVLKRLGDDIVRDIVVAILCGENVRMHTEGLTQQRIALSNAALAVAYLRALSDIPDLSQRLPELVYRELLDAKISSAHRMFLRHLIGLTTKGIQNILRSEPGQFKRYLDAMEETLSYTAKSATSEFGEIHLFARIDTAEHCLNWRELLQLFTAIGTQALVIRGSEKALYGKMFEKLTLGALLTILGFQIIDPNESALSSGVFWLSERGAKRESDATLLYKPGVGVRFDIGFIGPGNTEISLDKVSRFEREMERGREHYFMSTIIIVDRVGEKSRIVELARQIGGTIVQMSMSLWVQEVAMVLRDKVGFRHEILSLPEEDVPAYLREKIRRIDISAFLK